MWNDLLLVTNYNAYRGNVLKLDLTKEEYNEVVDKLMLLNDKNKLDKILEMRIKNYSIIQMAEKLNISTSTVSYRISILSKKLKKYYNNIKRSW